MSTFQRIFILFLFAILGLAAAGIIVQTPFLALSVRTGERTKHDLEQRSNVKFDTAARDQDMDTATEDTTAEWPIFVPIEELIIPTPAKPTFDDRTIATDSAAADESEFEPPKQLLFPAEQVVVGPLPSPPTLPPAPVVSIGEPSQQQVSDQNKPRAASVEKIAQAQSVAPFPDIGTAFVDQPQPTSQARTNSTTTVAASRLFPDEGDGMLDINIPDTDIREVLQLLSEAGNLNILASKNVTGQVKATLTGVDVNTALSAILRSTGYVARREGDFVYVGTAEDFQAMDHAVDRITTRIYRPNYVTASELQTLITPMLTPVVGTVSVSSAAEAGIGSDASNTGGNNFAGAEVVLVRDYETSLAQIDQVFSEVDRRPLQVSIEAMILSVKFEDEQSIGVDWELFRRNNNVRLAFGSHPADLGAINTGNNSGLVFGYLDSNIGFFLDALEKIGETHVISQPRLMCLNKQRAEIHIGEERGYVSTTVTETSATQSVEFLEVGTQLRLRPYISSDGMIRLEVHPELSTGTVEVSDNFTLPNKTVTQVTTNVMVRDGATLVIGGLIREDLQTDTEQIPLLGSLPVVGPLFRSRTDKTQRDEIIVLITPRIVWEPRFNCEGEYADCEFHQQHAIMADKMSPISRDFFGRKYRRLAKAAWVAGDAKAALRYANLSIHFNRLDRETIHLRSEIIAQSGLGDHNVFTHLKPGLYPWQHPVGGAALTDWVLDELHGPHTHLGQEAAPFDDPGVSGPSRDVGVPMQLRQPEFVVPQSAVEERIVPEGE